MKKLDKPQINSKIYWNHIYTTPAREKDYWENTNRFSYFVELVKDGDKVIDLGCGVGIPCRMINTKKKKCETWGVDISSEVIANNKIATQFTTWKQGHIGNLGFLPVDYFDKVFCGEVIEHLDDPSVAFQDAYRILKKGGKFVITTPIENHIDSPEHQWEFTKEDITKLFTDAGFTNIEFKQLPDLEHTYVFFAVGTK